MGPSLSTLPSTSTLVQRQPEGVPEGFLSEAARNHLLTLAEEAIRASALEDARRILQGLAILDRDHAFTWAQLGRVEWKLGHIEDARDALALALALDPSDVASGVDLAEVHRDLGDLAQAQAVAIDTSRRLILDDDHLRRVGQILAHPAAPNGEKS